MKEEFDRYKNLIGWDDRIKGMLGKIFTILETHNFGENFYIIALPSPDGSQNGKWYFPSSVLKIVTGKHSK